MHCELLVSSVLKEITQCVIKLRCCASLLHVSYLCVKLMIRLSGVEGELKNLTLVDLSFFVTFR